MIALLTDFGHADPFVGVMKGVILSIHPRASIVDLSHGVPAHDVRAAAHALGQGVAFFPRGTIFVAVVDPGVGSGRDILAVRTDRHTFLAPDNGLLDGLPAREVRRVACERLFLKPVSHTFHGRDIFAPVAAHLSRGMALSKVGPRLKALPARLGDPRLARRGGAVVGEVVHVDRFGNLVTNIPAADVAGPVRIRVGRRPVAGMVDSYAEGRPGRAVGIVGSGGTLEIAVGRGRADRLLAAGVGDPVEVRR